MGALHIMGFSGTDNPPSGALQGAVTGTVGSALGTTAATSTTPWGFATSTQADAVTTLVNTLRVDVLANTALVNQLRSDLVELGLIKGSA
jgi:hypothetical protein